jgi:hypothetical protein
MTVAPLLVAVLAAAQQGACWQLPEEHQAKTVSTKNRQNEQLNTHSF